MRRFFAAAVVLFTVFILKSAVCEAQQIPAYIDWVSGVVIGRGEAVVKTGMSITEAHLQAIEDAKKNILIVLERLNLTQDTTVGKYLTDNPEKRSVLTRFVDTAIVINEKKDGAVKVTLSLPVEGDDGLRAVMKRLEGEEESQTAEEEIVGSIAAAGKKNVGAESQASKIPPEIAEPYRIALLTFENKTNFQTVDLGGEFTQRLKDAFKRDRRFVFLSPGESKKVLEKNEKTEDDLKNSEVTETIRLEGVNGVVLGSVTRYEQEVKKSGVGGTGYLEMRFHITLDMRILDARSGKWMFYEEIPVTLEDRTFSLKSADDAEKFILITDLNSDHGLAAKTFRNVIASAERDIRVAFPLEGYVLKVLGDRIYINLTSVDGIKKDDILTVFRLGDMLTDPITGKEIDRIKDRIGTIKVVDVKDTYSQAVVDEVIEPIREGDVVSFH